nr:site-specific DNA-methyltransferase [Campylobacter sp. IFREMER_LSEM_CL2256]
MYSFTQSEMRVSENISFYSSQKPENMLRRIIQSSSDENSVVMDFFVGSGTTLAVSHKLNRKYIGIEMGEHFYEKYLTFNKDTKKYEYRLGLLGRMKNVIAGDIEFCAIDKKRRSSLSKMINFKGGGAFRYYELESYEESLENCEYKLDENSLIDYRKSRKLIKALKKGENICLDMKAYDKEFDIFLTMSNLLGLQIKNIFIDENGIKSCKFENDEIINLANIDLIKYPKLKNLIWWEK